MSSISWNATPTFSPNVRSGWMYSVSASEKITPTSAAVAISEPVLSASTWR